MERTSNKRGKAGLRSYRIPAFLLITVGLLLLIAAVSLGKNGPNASGYQFAVDSSGTGAPGQRCQGLSKKHVKGEKGTPFSRCVTEDAHSR